MIPLDESKMHMVRLIPDGDVDGRFFLISEITKDLISDENGICYTIDLWEEKKEL